MPTRETLVFDTGPLSIFASQGWLGALKAVVGARQAMIPDVVADELRVGASCNGQIQAALDADWIVKQELRSGSEIRAYAEFAALLVRGDRNRGEAGVLALASTIGGVAVVDDAAARKAAEARGVALRPTLALLVESVRSGLLTVPLVEAITDDLIAGSYRLPFSAGEFWPWAKENGLL